MKKSEILTILKENNVKSTNLKTFLNSRKDYRALDFLKVQKWLLEEEKNARKAFDKKMLSMRAKSFNLSKKEFQKLQEKARHILKFFGTGYSMGDVKTLKVNGKILISIDYGREYANRCSYRAKHGKVEINLNKKQLKEIALDEYHIFWVLPDGRKLVESGWKGTYSVDLK